MILHEGRVSSVFGRRYPPWRLQANKYPIARTSRRVRQGGHGDGHGHGKPD
jgi:hypothetical protein